MDSVVWGPHLLDAETADPDGFCLAERTGGAPRDWYGWRCGKEKDHQDDCGDWRRLAGLVGQQEAPGWNEALNRYVEGDDQRFVSVTAFLDIGGQVTVSPRGDGG